MEAQQPRTPIKLITEGSYARLWWAGLFSSTGDWVALFATLALAARIGAASGAAETAILVPLVARVLPGLFFAAVGGVLADRVDRKRTMVIADVGRGMLVVSLAFVDNLPMLFAVSLTLELFTLLWQPAKEATVPNLVHPGDLASANSLGLTAAYGTFPLGAGLFWMFQLLPTVDLGGVLRAGPVALAFAVDSLTFFASAAFIATIAFPVREKAPTRRAGRFDLAAPFRDTAEGLRFVASHRSVRPVVIGMATALFGGGVLFALGESYARRVLGADEAGFAALLFALGLGAAGGIIGAGMAGSRAMRTDVVFGFSLLTVGVALLAASAVRTVVGGMGWIFVVGLGTGSAYVMGFTHLHGTVEDAYRGRTFAALIALLRTGLLASLAVAGASARLLDDRLPAPFDNGTRTVMLLGGMIVIGSGAVVLWGLRHLFRRPKISEDAQRSVEEASEALTSLRGSRRPPLPDDDEENP